MPSRKHKNRGGRRKRDNKNKKKHQKRQQNHSQCNNKNIIEEKKNEDNINIDVDKDTINQCSHCSKEGVLLRCSGCKVVFYCDQQCQRSDWKQHKTICKLIQHNIKNQSKNEWYDKSKYLDRINKLLNIYWNVMNDENKKKKVVIVEMICNQYPNADIHKFVVDYIQYVENMDDNKVYLQNIDDEQECHLRDCIAVKREYRDRGDYDTDYNKRKTLYDGHSEEIEIVIIQMMDCLHNIKHHLFDMGLRYNTNNEWKQQNIKQIMNGLKQKRNGFNKIRHDRKCNIGLNNKFMTKILEEEKKGQNDEENKMATYSFGVDYYYHDYFKYNTEKSPDFNPQIYRLCDWFIAAKFKSIKEEVLNGKHVKLTKIQFDNTLIKTRMRFNVLKQKMKVNANFKTFIERYKINERITLKHMLAVLLYTNHTELSSSFSETFRKISGSESNESMKDRHSQFAHWGRLLKETVHCWGTHYWDTPHNVFYHGISCKLLFDALHRRFHAPTSTSMQYVVAVTFANQGKDANGLVIKINNSWQHGNSWYFNCVPFSDFPYEMEMLFLGVFQPLQISGMIAIGEAAIYDEWIRAINAFQMGLIKAIDSRNKILEADKDSIDLLLQNITNARNDIPKNRKVVPLYIKGLFANILDNTKYVTIDMEYLKKDKLYVNCFGNPHFGYKLLSDIYLTAKKEIKWQILTALYSSLHTIHVKREEHYKFHDGRRFDDGSKYSPSILIDDCLLETILSHLSVANNTLKYIQIHYPKNTTSSLQELITAHQSSYNRQNFKLEIKKTNDSRFGSYLSFRVLSKLFVWQ